MRNLIKNILKEETNRFDVREGDIYSIEGIRGRLVRIENITCNGINEGTLEKLTDRWGKVKFYHDGCYLKYKVSDDNGKGWYWDDGDSEYRVEKNWVNFIIEKGFWNLEMRDDVDFFNINEAEDDFGWAQDAIRNTPNLELGEKVVVTNRGSYYPSYTEAMLELGIPGMEDFINTYGKHWWKSIPHDFGPEPENTRDIFDHHEEWLYHKIPALGVPENGDICYIIGQPIENGEDEYYWLYRLYRESDGKQFVMGRDGFEPVDDNVIKEQDELGWAEDLVKDQIDYPNVKWIRTSDGKRFKNMTDRKEVTDDYHPHPRGWSRFRGWDNWFLVNGFEVIDGVPCYITSLSAQPGKKGKEWLYSHMNYFTPVEDYNDREISFNEERPRVGNEQRP